MHYQNIQNSENNNKRIVRKMAKVIENFLKVISCGQWKLLNYQIYKSYAICVIHFSFNTYTISIKCSFCLSVSVYVDDVFRAQRRKINMLCK